MTFSKIKELSANFKLISYVTSKFWQFQQYVLGVNYFKPILATYWSEGQITPEDSNGFLRLKKLWTVYSTKYFRPGQRAIQWRRLPDDPQQFDQGRFDWVRKPRRCQRRERPGRGVSLPSTGPNPQLQPSLGSQLSSQRIRDLWTNPARTSMSCLLHCHTSR